MDFYNSAENLDIRKIAIPDYPNRKQIRRDLLNVNHRLNQEWVSWLTSLQVYRRINASLTKAGAEEYIVNNHNKGWYAWECDITGPKGVLDGILEVIVTDRNGNIKIVNGYTLT